MNNKLAQNVQVGTEIKLDDLRFHHESHQVTVPAVIHVNVHDLANAVGQQGFGLDDLEIVAHPIAVEPQA